MIKPKSLRIGDKIAIVSLSRGLLGEPFIKHELELGMKRLEEMGLVPAAMEHALDGIETLAAHPEYRAVDLKQAFIDKTIRAVITAIGGDDTYQTLPYLMNDEEFVTAVKNDPKIFCGFSDTTMNHLMFYRLGLETFYGPALITDLAELDTEMLPYTKKYLNKFLTNDIEVEIESSEVWYDDRENYGVEAIGTSRTEHTETHGFEVLKGTGKVRGKLYGGCIEVFYMAMTGWRHEDAKEIVEKAGVLLSPEEYADKILFLETSDECPTPEELERMLFELKKQGMFGARGIIVGKPMQEKYYDEYKEVWQKVLADAEIPVLYNVNFGHAVPRCIVPYGVETEVDYGNKTIKVVEPLFSE